ncbi:helix-turn-helix domain-containing protein [Sphingobium nicotianae]|uniref:Helix-turn-helix domain-containing protein n=1 Tax=Sphingobium nicotianae TaxID=2782607 RepID=A0A9X1IT89_9SPHN|nr:helix-turn-helix domain-containing protein [Sphingobium nicotianae]MBT2189075.1 helix-turn-helix domain-containing protein [Sphingobium nicotianae]
MTHALSNGIEFNAPAMALAVKRLGVRMTFPKGVEIFGQDEEADLVYGLMSGAVRTTRMLSDGRRQIGNFYSRGDLIGLTTGPVHRFSAETLSDCSFRVVKRSSIQLHGGDDELDDAIWEAMRRELEQAQEHLLFLGRTSACERVARFLISIAPRNSSARVALPMNRQDMADYLGLAIETVSRTVSHLQASEIIEFSGCRYFRVLRWDALELLAA